MAKKDGSFPYDATPDVHHFNGVPESCFDVVNMYGTYNIQPTSDTENRFPPHRPGPAEKAAGYAHRQGGPVTMAWDGGKTRRPMPSCHLSMMSCQKKQTFAA